MQVVEYDDIDVRIHYTCPECSKGQIEFLDREPDSFDTNCEECGLIFTVNCYGDI